MSVDTPGDWIENADEDGAYAIACAIMALTRAIDRLGNADAITPMGAIEAFGLHIGEKLDALTNAISELNPS